MSAIGSNIKATISAPPTISAVLESNARPWRDVAPRAGTRCDHHESARPIEMSISVSSANRRPEVSASKPSPFCRWAGNQVRVSARPQSAMK